MNSKFNLKIALFFLAAFLISGINSAAAENNTETLNKIINEIKSTNAETSYILNETESAVKSIEAESKTSPITLDLEGEGLTGNIEGKRYQLKDAEISKTIKLGGAQGLINKKAEIEKLIKKLEAEYACEAKYYEINSNVLKYVKTLYSQKNLIENLKIAKSSMDAVAKRYEVSLASKMDLKQIKIDNELQAVNASANQKNAEMEYALLLNNSGETFKNIIDGIKSKTDLLEITQEIRLLVSNILLKPENTDYAFQTALKRRSDYKAAQYEIELYQTVSKIESRSQSPELKIGFFRSVNDLSEIERGFKLGLSIPIYDYQKSELSKQAMLLKSGFNPLLLKDQNIYLQYIKNKINIEIIEKVTAHNILREKAIKFADTLIPEAAEVFKMSQTAYIEGVISFTEYQAAKRNYFEIYETFINSLFDYYVALLELRRAEGFKCSENDFLNNIYEFKVL